MKISLISIGKTNSNALEGLIADLEKRLPKYIKYKRIELPDVKNAKNLSVKELKKLECDAFQKHIAPQDFVIILDEKGKSKTSNEFAKFLQHHMNISTTHIVFIVGGAYGFTDECKQKANLKLSFSPMTFTHQMIRLFFTEQLYRAFSIIEGKPYHNN